MIVFELAAAIAAMAAASQQAEPPRSASRERISERPGTRTAPGSTQPRENTRGQRSVNVCSRSNTAYNAKTHTYRDARGKRQRCAR